MALRGSDVVALATEQRPVITAPRLRVQINESSSSNS